MVNGRNPKSLFIRSVALLAFLSTAATLFILIQKMTHEIPERAWITVRGATIIGPLIQHNVPKATILLENTGPTSALNTRGRLVMTIWPSNTFPDWEMPLQLTTDAEDIGEIGPGSTVPRAISLLAPLTDVQGMHLERKDWFIVILGVVTYTDGTGTVHKTSLCLVWRDTADEKLSPCEKWNEVN